MQISTFLCRRLSFQIPSICCFSVFWDLFSSTWTDHLTPIIPLGIPLVERAVCFRVIGCKCVWEGSLQLWLAGRGTLKLAPVLRSHAAKRSRKHITQRVRVCMCVCVAFLGSAALLCLLLVQQVVFPKWSHSLYSSHFNHIYQLLKCQKNGLLFPERAVASTFSLEADLILSLTEGTL